MITIDDRDETTQCILISVRSNVLKTELEASEATCLPYFLTCKYNVIIQIICNNYSLNYKVITEFSHLLLKRRWMIRG